MIITIDISQIVYKTGVSRYTENLVRHLLRLDSRNQYKLFAGVWQQREVVDQYLSHLTSEGLSFTPYVKLFPPKLADRVWNQWHIWSIERFVGKTDLVHTSNWTQPPSTAKKVTTIHDMTPLLYPEHHVPVIVENFKRNLQWVEKECEAVICDSEATKQDLIRFTSIPEAQLSVVYLAADERFKRVELKKEIERLKAKYNITGKYVLSVGTQEPRKNIWNVIEAFLQLRLPHHQLVLVGKHGWGSQNSELRTQNSVVETGFVPDEDLPALYSGAEVFVYPSLYEGFGLPVLEAMQGGCPVITSNISSLPEVVGDAGLQVNPESINEIAQAIKSVLENPALQVKMSKQSLEQAKTFNWAKTARETIEVYEAVIYENMKT